MKRPTSRKAPAKAVRTAPKVERARIKRTVRLAKADPNVVAIKKPASLVRIFMRWLTAALVALVIFVLVAVFSPMLAVEKIEIRGNDRIALKSLEKALAGEIGRPLPQVTVGGITERLKSFSLIQSVSVVNLPPHLLQVRIVERQPICVISTSKGDFLYDPAGVQIAKASSSDMLPLVSAAGNLGSGAEFKAAVDALLALPVDLYDRVALVSATSIDSITFKLRGYAGQRVIWGDSSQSALKAKVLDALVRNHKRSERVTYDVSSPKAPTVRY